MAKKLKIAVLATEFRWTNSVLKAFERTGHEIFRVSVDTKSVKDIFRELEEIAPDFCYSHNFHICKEWTAGYKDDIHYFFAENKFPFAIWYLDNPEVQGDPALKESWRTGPFPKNCLFFVNDSSFASFFKKRELPSFHLPIGVDRDIIRFDDHSLTSKWRADLRFSGSAIVSFKPEPPSVEVLREGHKYIYAEELIRSIESDLSRASQSDAESWFQNFLEAVNHFFDVYYTTPEDYFKAEQNFYNETKRLPEFYQREIQKSSLRIAELYSWCQMTCYLFELQSRGMIVQGSPDWAPLFPDQKEVPRHLSWEELFASYRAAKINFCFTKWSLPTAMHDRVYEILLAGGFPLTDYREYLPEAFRKDEIVHYRTIEEAKHLIDYYLKADTEREKLIRKGRDRVLSDHTYDIRVAELIRQSVLHWNL
ncbi:MAG: CgeB family protein [Bacteriovoracaceae bacterium]|nr:CgeB family protein [Bacteriovoracaceae bacterium]